MKLRTIGKKSPLKKARNQPPSVRVSSFRVFRLYSQEVDEPKEFDTDAEEGSLDEDEDDAAEEADGAPEFLFPREKGDGPLGSDDEGQTGDEENLRKTSVRCLSNSPDPTPVA